MHNANFLISAVGDVFPGDHYFSLGHGVRSMTLQGRLNCELGQVADTIRRSSVAICNLEGPLSNVSSRPSPVEAAAFRGAPEFAGYLKRCGFSHVNVANNHSLQHGLGAFEETVSVLTSNGLSPVGLSGHHVGYICEPVIVGSQGRKRCIVAYSAVPERHAPGVQAYARIDSEEAVLSEIRNLSRQFDDVIVTVHAGDEGIAFPAPAVVRLYREMVHAGARCVLGHHSHVFQPVEQYEDGLIAYSLGNFLFDLLWNRAMTESAILVVNLSETSIQWRLVPIFLDPSLEVRHMADVDARRFVDDVLANGAKMSSVDGRAYASLLSRSQQQDVRKKLPYFLRNSYRGDLGLKLRFLVNKMMRRVVS